MHTALLRIAEYDKKLNVDRLEAIREKILDNNFSFEFVCRTFENKINKNLLARVVVHPEIDRFNYYAIIEEYGKLRCRVHIYNGRTAVFFGENFFYQAKWIGNDELVISGKEKEMDISISITECKANFVNLTRYAHPPYFTLMRADISEEEREKAHQDWQHSLPPAVAAAIRQARN